MQTSSKLLYLSNQIVPPIIDIVSLFGFIFLVPWLGSHLFSESLLNHLLLLPTFFLIFAGIIAIRSLPKTSKKADFTPGFFEICLIFFLMIAYSLLYAYGTNIGGSESNNDNIAILIFFIILIPIIIAFYWPITNPKPKSGKALAAESIGLISVNYLTLIGASVWYYFTALPTGENPVYATGIWFLILYLILFFLFLAFFGLPRLYLFRATKNKIGLAIYLLTLAVFLWDKVPPVN